MEFVINCEQKMVRPRDSQAEIFYFQGREFAERVITPALRELVPISPSEIGGPRKFRVQIARDNAHNALCYETRVSFTLAVGAMFERQLRLWLVLAAPNKSRLIEQSTFERLISLVLVIKAIDLNALPQADDINELWNVANVARHGDGKSAEKLFSRRAEFWGHMDDGVNRLYFDAGLRAYSMRISDSDLMRYCDAISAFWEIAALHPAQKNEFE